MPFTETMGTDLNPNFFEVAYEAAAGTGVLLATIAGDSIPESLWFLTDYLIVALVNGPAQVSNVRFQASDPSGFDVTLPGPFVLDPGHATPIGWKVRDYALGFVGDITVTLGTVGTITGTVFITR